MTEEAEISEIPPADEHLSEEDDETIKPLEIVDEDQEKPKDLEKSIDMDIEEEEPIDMDLEHPEEHPEPRKEPETPQIIPEISPEALEKSKIQKDAFMEMFRIAPRVRDILPDLRVFVSHPDVIDSDRKEIQELVDVKIRAEKAKKKAEKAANKEKELAEKEKDPGSLADVIKNATGLDLAGILARAGKAPPTSTDSPMIIPVVAGVPTLNLVPQVAPPPSFSAPPPPVSIGTAPVQNVGRGKAGFSTPHPNEVPVELRHVKPDLIAPIPDALRSVAMPGKKEVAAIPNALLPPDQQIFEVQKVYVRPGLRKSLYLAGARPGKRSDRIKEELEKLEKEKNRIRDEKDPLGALNRSLPPGVPPYPTNFPEKRPKRGGNRDFERRKTMPRPLAPGLNKNSPLAVKRYHARQLAKETGMSPEEALAEIEEQCREFGGEETEENRKANEEYMSHVKRRGDEAWNSKHNYTPIDHSQGIPGVDRPPSGMPGRNREDREDRSNSGNSRFPPRGQGVPGVDRPPGAGRNEDWNRDSGRTRRKRGGVKEREKRMRREDYGGGGGYGGGGRSGPPGNKYGRYDENPRGQRNQRGGYEEYGNNTYHQEQTGYEDHAQNYEGYYEGQNQNYDYSEQGGYDGNYEYYQGHAGAEGSYYQEDGGQYYNEYYGTTDQSGYQDAYQDAGAPGAPPK